MHNFSILGFLKVILRRFVLPAAKSNTPWTAKSEAFAGNRWTKPPQQYGLPTRKDHGGAGLPPQGHPAEGLQEVQAEDRGHCGGCRRFFLIALCRISIRRTCMILS